MFSLSEFGTKVFNEKIMKEKLPSPVYKKWIETMEKKDSLDRVTADAIAHAMKEWALEHNCTHYCHWFQPLTGLTAVKESQMLPLSQMVVYVQHLKLAVIHIGIAHHQHLFMIMSYVYPLYL